MPVPHIQTDHLSGMQPAYGATSPLQSPSTGMSDEIMYPSPSYMQQSFPHHYPLGNNVTSGGGGGSPHTSGTTSVINSPLTPSSASVPSFVGIQVSPTAASRMSGGNMKMDLDIVEPHLGRPGSGGGGGGESGSGSGSATIPSESVWMHHLGQFHHPPEHHHHHHGLGGGGDANERGGSELTGQIEMILEGHGGSVFVKQNGNRGHGGGRQQGQRQDHPFHGHHGQSTHNETYDLPMC